jgi:hypothetical protein
MTNGDQQQQQQQPAKDKGWNMAKVEKWIGPLVFLGVVGYGVYAFVNKKWPFDGSIMLPTLPSLGGDGTGGGGLFPPAGAGTQNSVLMNTGTGASNLRMIQRQIMTNIGSGGHVDPSAISGTIQAQIAAERAKAAQLQQSILAKFPSLPKHTIGGLM